VESKAAGGRFGIRQTRALRRRADDGEGTGTSQKEWNISEVWLNESNVIRKSNVRMSTGGDYGEHGGYERISPTREKNFNIGEGTSRMLTHRLNGAFPSAP